VKIVHNPEACYGCRTCELMCAFHHTGEFSPGGGSIRVFKDYDNGAIFWEVDVTCDFCSNERQPLCVKYCSYKALTLCRREEDLEPGAG